MKRLQAANLLYTQLRRCDIHRRSTTAALNGSCTQSHRRKLILSLQRYQHDTAATQPRTTSSTSPSSYTVIIDSHTGKPIPRPPTAAADAQLETETQLNNTNTQTNTSSTITDVSPSTSTAASSSSSTSLSSMSSVLSPAHRRILIRLRYLFERLPNDLRQLNLKDADKKLIKSTIDRLEELFMFVVVGEYNSGKSSFLNALLGQAYCKTGILPTTDKINILRYADPHSSPSATSLEPAAHIDDPNTPNIQSLYLPVPFLQQLSVVDTPGTNAILTEHQQITEWFIPRSDAVLFVTSVERPFSESERVFLHHIHSWKKKIVMIINKIDLIEQSADREKIVRFVQEHAKQALGEECMVFPVSSKLGLQVKQQPSQQQQRQQQAADVSGFVALEQYLFHTLSSTAKIKLKLSSPLGVLDKLLSGCMQVVSTREKHYVDDQRLLDTFLHQLQALQTDTKQQLEQHIQRIDNVFNQRIVHLETFMYQRVTLRQMLNTGESIRAEFDNQVYAGLDEQVIEAMSGMLDWLHEKTHRTVLYINQCIQQRNAVREQQQQQQPQQPQQRQSTYNSSSTETNPSSSSSLSSFSLQAPIAALDVSGLSAAVSPSHQTFVQLQTHIQEPLTSVIRAEQAIDVQRTARKGAALTFATEATAVGLAGVSLFDLIPVLSFSSTYLPVFSAATLSLAGLYIIPYLRTRLLSRQQQYLNQCRTQFTSLLQKTTDRLSTEQYRHLELDRQDLHRQMEIEEREIKQINDIMQDIQKEMAEIREQIRVS